MLAVVLQLTDHIMTGFELIAQQKGNHYIHVKYHLPLLKAGNEHTKFIKITNYAGYLLVLL